MRLPPDSALAAAKGTGDLPIVRVVWRDACSTDSWQDMAEVRDHAKLLEVQTVGFLVKRAKDLVVVTQNVSENAAISNRITIPTGWIKRLERLR